MGVVLVAVVALPFLLVMLNVPMAPAIGHVVVLCAMVVVQGPGPFQPAMDPVYSGETYLFVWTGVALLFGFLTHRVARVRTVLALAIAAVAVCLVPLAVAADRRLASDWRTQPPAALHQTILAKTPLGTSMADVRGVVEREGWKLQQFNQERGFYDQRPRPARQNGVQHIEANAGNYQGLPFVSNVTVYWAFDASGRLIDVWVWRTTDGL